ncbi:MAG: tetratricopeptide repeat protein [Planctomycetota bacterium]|jgi:tetratricopeptide (TPR) repeat protein
MRNKPQKRLPKNTNHSDPKGTCIVPIARLAGLIILVAAVVAITYSPALSAKALCFDDSQYLTENYLVQNPSLASAGRFLSEILEPSTVDGYYQPLNMISLMLDYAMGGREQNLKIFHRNSLVLHICNTCLMIVLLYMLFKQPLLSAMAGLLFGLHPMTVETIAWVGERKTILAAFFALWSLIFYVRYTRTLGWKSYAACLLMYLLALMSKPTSTPLPVVMLLIDFWPLKRLDKKAIVEKIPLLLIGGIFVIITVISQGQTAFVSMPSEYSPARAPLILCHNIIFYLFHIVWPVNLSSHYPFPRPFDLSNPMMAIGVIGTCLLLAFLLISLRRTRALLTGWLIFFVTIFPTMGVIGFTNVIASDKFAYLPSVGLLMILTWTMTRFPSGQQRIDIIKVGIVAAVMILAGLEIGATRRYLHKWKNTDTLNHHMLAIAPESPNLLNTIGLYLADRGKTDEAMEHYKKSLQLEPNYPRTLNNLGALYTKRGQIDEAIIHYRKAIRARYDFPQAHYNLGVMLAKQKRFQQAIQAYNKAIKLKPKYPQAFNNLGNAFNKMGKTEQAIPYYRKAVELMPTYSLAHNNLASCLTKMEKYEEAMQHYEKSLQHKPDYAHAYNNLGTLLAQLSRTKEAIQHFRKAIQFDPDSLEAHFNLGTALTSLGKVDEAIQAYRKVLQIEPGHPHSKKRLKELSATTDK